MPSLTSTHSKLFYNTAKNISKTLPKQKQQGNHTPHTQGFKNYIAAMFYLGTL